jgi:hypothetical protein
MTCSRESFHNLWIWVSWEENVHVLECTLLHRCVHQSSWLPVLGMKQRLCSLGCREMGVGATVILGAFHRAKMLPPLWFLGWQGILSFYFPSKAYRFESHYLLLEWIIAQMSPCQRKAPGNKHSWAKHIKSAAQAMWRPRGLWKIAGCVAPLIIIQVQLQLVSLKIFYFFLFYTLSTFLQK